MRTWVEVTSASVTASGPADFQVPAPTTDVTARYWRIAKLATADLSRYFDQERISGRAYGSTAAMLVIPGGFSYGDDISAGRVLGLELRHGLSRELSSFVDRGGFVLGICNGFQALVESGLFEPEARLDQRSPAAKTIATRSGTSPARKAHEVESPSQEVPTAARNIALYNNASNRFDGGNFRSSNPVAALSCVSRIAAPVRISAGSCGHRRRRARERGAHTGRTSPGVRGQSSRKASF